MTGLSWSPPPPSPPAARGPGTPVPPPGAAFRPPSGTSARSWGSPSSSRLDPAYYRRQRSYDRRGARPERIVGQLHPGGAIVGMVAKIERDLHNRFDLPLACLVGPEIEQITLAVIGSEGGDTVEACSNQEAHLSVPVQRGGGGQEDERHAPLRIAL